MLAQRPAFDELGGDVIRPISLADLINRENVRVIQRRCRPRLSLEAAHPLGLSRELRGQQLERDLAPELHILRQVHFAHAAHAQQRHDRVVTDLLPDCQLYSTTGEQFSRDIRRGVFDEALCSLMGLEERLDFPLQGFVAGASLCDEEGALLRRTL